MERAERILAKELRNRDEIDCAIVRVDELRSLRELVSDAVEHGDDAPALERAETIFEKGLRDQHERGAWWRQDTYAAIAIPELRNLHELVLVARKAGAP